MRMKSYFAATVEAALSLARLELGPEAMLVNSRRTNPEARHLGEYEVVCALVNDQVPRATIEAAAAFRLASPPPLRAPSLVPSPIVSSMPNMDRLSRDVSDMKRHMERLASAIARSSTGYSNLAANPGLAEAFALLTSSEVDPNLAFDIISQLGSEPGETSPFLILQSEVRKLMAVESRLGRVGSRRAIVALVGPPGSGKTTSLIKLAVRYALTSRRPSQILSLDTYRVGAAEQLRSYAAILGIGFQVVETTLSLAQALEEHSHKEMILIDTPGFGRHDLQDGADIAKFLSTRGDIDVHLLVPASMKAGDATRTIDQYEIFRPAKLLFTRTDETETFGPILNQVVRTGKPVSFLTGGQQIPEDLQAASKECLTDLILRTSSAQKELAPSVAAA